jgi:hypothetical protein
LTCPSSPVSFFHLSFLLLDLLVYKLKRGIGAKTVTEFENFASSREFVGDLAGSAGRLTEEPVKPPAGGIKRALLLLRVDAIQQRAALIIDPVVENLKEVWIKCARRFANKKVHIRLQFSLRFRALVRRRKIKQVTSGVSKPVAWFAVVDTAKGVATIQVSADWIAGTPVSITVQ